MRTNSIFYFRFLSKKTNGELKLVSVADVYVEDSVGKCQICKSKLRKNV